MTNAIELPAMLGTDPLGFLSALGTFRLLAEHRDSSTRLSWNRTTGTAVVHTTIPSLDELADWLVSVALEITDGGVLPSAAPGIPLAKEGTGGSDPMRPPRDEYRYLADRSTQLDSTNGVRWLEVISTDLACDNQGKAALTPWMAPSGQQTARSFFKVPLDSIRKEPALLRDALTRWHRRNDYSGEYLDYRALNDAAASPEGRSSELGAPGPTWLAVMALPLLRVTGDGFEGLRGTMWSPVPTKRGQYAIWPLWDIPLDLHAVRVLLEHPALRPTQRGFDESALRGLGVFRLGAARRRQLEGRNFRGVLAPISPEELTAAGGGRG